MQTDQQSSSASETNLQSEYIVSSDANSGVTASTSDPALLQQPAKRPTRQWAAWTREEEESFFTALRQVGKNFEKITCRVKSKNKDQVRHYYYRLVRRMNKLLGPTLCLDAKNSKDTNAAMLRWWSLLEKYSCKASKLHLKPRRFKVFVETLEHQLLKDRKKNVRKRPSQAENASPSPSTAANHSKPPGPDSHPVKMVLVDSQNIQKLGPGKPSFKRNIGIGTNRANCKGESTSVKQVRQRRKPGVATSTAYKKWEKAAIAGVSLVADAAEHVERTAADKDNANDQRQKFPDSVSGTLPPLPPLSQNHVPGSDLQTCSKLKLQLFPIDDSTRRALEMDNHNPHLELTLSTRKKISSVLEHLNRKWGSSSVASGELILFPYGVQREDMVGCRSWTQDSPANAADVYAIIGSPPVFRLRYGWFTNVEAAATPCFGPRDMMLDGPLANHRSAMVGDEHSEQPLSMSKVQDPLPVSTGVPGQMDGSAIRCPNSKFSKPSDDAGANISCYSKLGTDENMKLNDGDDLRSGNSIALSAGEWADSLTNVSVGDLLLEVACNEDVDYANSPVIKSPQRMQPFSVSCDSFDAAVAAHISKYQNKMSFQSTLSPHISSIWDGEETCDAFSFQRSAAYKEAPRPPGNISTEAAEQIEQMSPSDSDGFLEVYEVETAAESPVRNDPVNDCLSDDQHILKNPEKDFSGLTDIYWPDSLGPLDLDVRSSNYHSEDLILSDSLSCLNRLIASSLDAFQSCSFFGLDKKEPEPKAESRENAPFRISSGV